ncbi:hypothetical protein Goarm_010186, partial [Gossypium armourianum]|nr:hypothetical protein [Gossypium armourianum]
LEQRGRETVGKVKPSVVNQEDFIRVKSDVSRGKSPKGREKLRRRDEIEANQVSAIRKSQRGHCENWWGKMSRVLRNPHLRKALPRRVWMNGSPKAARITRRKKREKNTKLSIQEQWKPPCESIIKINFDGAFDVHQARSGFGVVARNSSGEMLASMVVCHRAIPSLFAAEAHACYQALRLGVCLGLDSIVIEGDSLTIIKKCRSDRRDNGDWDHYCKCSTLQGAF